MDKSKLKAPKHRRSIEVINSLRQDYLNDISEDILQKTSPTINHHSPFDLHGMVPDNYLQRNMAHNEYDESSLGLLDFDKDSDDTNLISKVKNDFKSLSFHPKEMAGRSTCIQSKESLKENRFSSLSCGMKQLDINDILRDANKQSKAVDEILKSSDAPEAANIRMSLDSYKQSLSGTRMRNTDSWNYRPDDFGLSDIAESSPGVRDSMFRPANKVDMSKEELSWMKEHGDLPVYQTSATFTSGSERNSSNRPPRHNDSLNDFTSLRSNNTNISKMSVGNYFSRRSENINHMLTAESPEKQGPFPPLCELEDGTDFIGIEQPSGVRSKLGETYNKRRATKSLPFQTLSDDSALSDRELGDQSTQNDVAVLTHVNNVYNSVHPNVCRDVTNFADESSYGSPISCSQIKNLIDNYDTGKRSIILDNLLKQTKQKKIGTSLNKGAKENFNDEKNNDTFRRPRDLERVKCGGAKTQQQFRAKSPGSSGVVDKGKLAESVRDVSPTLPERSSFGHVSNIFHSTKHGDESAGNEKSIQELTPISADKFNLKKSESSRSQSTINNEEYSSEFVSTLKNYGKSTSGSSGYTDHSTKSSGTVIQAKHFNPLMPIIEGERGSAAGPSGDRDKDIGYSTVRHSQDLSISESSKEILNLMSPASSKNKSYEMKSTIWDEGISSMKVSLNNLSKECLPSNTPYKTERLNLTRTESTKLESSNNSDFSINIPSGTDWIAIDSEEKPMIVGISNEIDLTVTSLCRRWVSVSFLVNSLHINNELYKGEDISEIILLQAPANALLLKADSQISCQLQAVPLVPNLQLRICLVLELVDVVTKANSQVFYNILTTTGLPQIRMKCDFIKSNALRFPCLPQGAEVHLPIVLYNDSHVDFPLDLKISCPQKDIFSIGSMSIMTRSEAEESVSKVLNMKDLIVSNEPGVEKTLLTDEEHFIIPKDKSMCIKMFLHYRAPILSGAKELNSVQYIDAILNVVIHCQSDPEVVIPLMRHSLVGGVGIMKLRLQSKQGVNPIVINQGSVEHVKLRNSGTLMSFYKLFIADISEEHGHGPSKKGCILIDKNEVNLKPGEEAVVTLSFPNASGQLSGDVHSKFVIMNSFNKEVYDIFGVSSSRSLSQQSVYSVDSTSSQPLDVVIKSSKREISWGSLKLGASQTKDLVLKNISNNRKLRIVVTINEDAFKLFDENGPTSSLTFVLLPQECKTLRVEFRPNKAGGHTGSVRVACRTKNTLNLLCKVLLHGVGDVSTLVFRDGVFKHGGSQGLPLGSFSESGDIKDIHFSIWNKGNASAFFLLNLDLKWRYRTLKDEIKVIPQCGIIGANCTMRCVVRVPKKAVLLARGHDGDFETLASLTILHGDDSTRQRIKRICSYNVINESIKEKWNEECQGKLDNLCMHFPEEDQYFGTIRDFKETPNALKLLLDELQQKEVSLTYDVNLENTVVRMCSDFDESIQFHTMLVDNTRNSVSSDV